MKRILFLANNDVGLYKFRKELIAELLKENKVYISLPYGDMVNELVAMGCEFIDTPVDRRGINPIADFKLIYKYYRMMKELKPNLNITYTIKPNIYASIVSQLLKIPYSVNITGLGTAFQSENMIKTIIVFLYKFALKKVNNVFFENVGNKNVFIEKNIIHEKKAIVLNGAGVNLDEYSFEAYPDEKEPIRFLFIARVMKEKGIDEFLYAAEKIKEQYDYVQFEVVGPYEDNYSEVIKQYVDKGIIDYYGFQKDVKSFIKNSHCFVLPSYHEGMANTNLECASMGRPLITSNIHGCKEAVVENISGFLCEKADKENLYMCMKKFINLSYEEKKIMGLESRIHMENVFDKSEVVKKTIERLSL